MLYPVELRARVGSTDNLDILCIAETQLECAAIFSHCKFGTHHAARLHPRSDMCLDVVPEYHGQPSFPVRQGHYARRFFGTWWPNLGNRGFYDDLLTG